ncbi:MAG: hypothetical protein JNG83_07725 [Opitutaceae bacterium]|nr:hypothetical protein [Opitutaceae bacterium]
MSSTGYRSLAGHCGVSGALDADAVSPEFLEALAVAQDRDRAALLARLRRTPVPTPDRLGNFIGVSIDAEAALAEGFFAPDAERFALWRGAFRLLQLIDTDARFQPAPTSPAWTIIGCTAALAARRSALAFLRQLARGELPPPPEGTHFAQRAYFELPSKADREPAFDLPAVTAELPLDLPSGYVVDDEEPEIEEEETSPVEDDPAQLSLL